MAGDAGSPPDELHHLRGVHGDAGGGDDGAPDTHRGQLRAGVRREERLVAADAEGSSLQLRLEGQ